MAYTSIPHRVVADTRLSNSDFRVLCAIAQRSGDDGGCRATLAQIQEQAGGKQERATQRAITRLQALGYIAISDDPTDESRRILTVVWSPAKPTDASEVA